MRKRSRQNQQTTGETGGGFLLRIRYDRGVRKGGGRLDVVWRGGVGREEGSPPNLQITGEIGGGFL